MFTQEVNYLRIKSARPLLVLSADASKLDVIIELSRLASFDAAREASVSCSIVLFVIKFKRFKVCLVSTAAPVSCSAKGMLTWLNVLARTFIDMANVTLIHFEGDR